MKALCRQMRKMLSALVTDTVSSLRRAFSVFPRQYVSLSLSLALTPSLPLPLPSSASLILCQWCLYSISPQKANEREKKIHYGLVLPCSHPAFLLFGLLGLLMLRRDRGVGVGKEGRKRLSLCQSPLKISEGKENEFKKTITKKESWGRGSMK